MTQGFLQISAGGSAAGGSRLAEHCCSHMGRLQASASNDKRRVLRPALAAARAFGAHVRERRPECTKQPLERVITSGERVLRAYSPYSISQAELCFAYY